MEFNEIKDEINKAIEGCDHPIITFLKPFLVMLFTLFENLNHQNENLNNQNEKLNNQNKNLNNQNETLNSQIETLNRQIETFNHLIETLNHRIETLEFDLQQKSLTARKANSQNIDGKKNESQKPDEEKPKDEEPRKRNSTDPNPDNPAPKKEKPKRNVKHVEDNVYYDITGKIINSEEANKLINTVFRTPQGKFVKITGFREVSKTKKVSIETTIHTKTYYEPQIKEVEEPKDCIVPQLLEPICDFHPEIEFAKYTPISIALMASMVNMRFSLKVPINRISEQLYEYDINFDRQSLARLFITQSYLLRPIYDRLLKKVLSSSLIGVDETYAKCREKLRKNPEKTSRYYIFGMVSEGAMYYFKSSERDTETPKNLLLNGNIDKDTFVISDAYYRISWNKDENGNKLFSHGLCYVHGKRNFVDLVNYATTKGEVTDKFSSLKDDVKDSKIIIEMISKVFQANNNAPKDADIVKYRQEFVKPLVDKLFNELEKHALIIEKQKRYSKIEKDLEKFAKELVSGKAGNKRKNTLNSKIEELTLEKNKIEKSNVFKRKFSKRFIDAVSYMYSKKEYFYEFLNNANGIMHNNFIERSFRELSLLRNAMMCIDSYKGGESLCIYYSIYKSVTLHGINFQEYLNHVFYELTKLSKLIEFSKDKRGTINGFVKHSIPDEVLENLMPWSEACKTACLPKMV